MDEHFSDLERTLAREPADHAKRTELIAALRRAEKHKEANVHVLEPRYAQAQYPTLSTNLEPFEYTFFVEGERRREYWMPLGSFTLLSLDEKRIKLSALETYSPAYLLSALEIMRAVLPILRVAFGNETPRFIQGDSRLHRPRLSWPSKGQRRKWAQVAHYLRDNYRYEPPEMWHRH